MFICYNAHPKQKLVEDCAKRAISKASGKDYREISSALNRHKKITGAQRFNSNNNWPSFIEQVLHGKKMSFPAIKGSTRITGNEFCKKYPKGKYILRMARHLTACVDGNIYDTWDCTDKCVCKAWKLM